MGVQKHSTMHRLCGLGSDGAAVMLGVESPNY